MSLVTDADPPAGFGDNGMAYNRSTDGGRTWEPAQLLIEDTDPRFLNDKNSMTADPNDANYVYAVWDRLQNANADTKLGPAENRVGLGFKGPIYFTRTTNGGDSWEPARKIWESGANKQALGDQIAVLPASRGGDVLDFFTEFLNASDRADHFPRWLSFIRSTDKGASWGKEERVDIEFPGSILAGRDGDSTIDVEPVPCPDPTETGSCPIRSGDFIPDVAVDQRNGNLYAVWMDLRFDGGIFLTDHDNIAFTMSTDGGRTWSPTIKVNQTPTTEPNYDQQAFTPSVDVAADGTVTVTYYDFRNNTAEPGDAGHRLLRRALPRQLRQPGELGRERDTHHAHLVRHPQGALRARLLPGRLHGPRVSRNRLLLRLRTGLHAEQLQPIREPARAVTHAGIDPRRARTSPRARQGGCAERLHRLGLTGHWRGRACSTATRLPASPFAAKTDLAAGFAARPVEPRGPRPRRGALTKRAVGQPALPPRCVDEGVEGPVHPAPPRSAAR